MIVNATTTSGIIAIQLLQSKLLSEWRGSPVSGDQFFMLKVNVLTVLTYDILSHTVVYSQRAYIATVRCEEQIFQTYHCRLSIKCK
jgi:hypothetical protein